MPVFTRVDEESPARALDRKIGLFGDDPPKLDCDTLPRPSDSFCCNACAAVAPGKGVFIGWDEKCRPICDCSFDCPKRDDDKTILGIGRPSLGVS